MLTFADMRGVGVSRMMTSASFFFLKVIVFFKIKALNKL